MTELKDKKEVTVLSLGAGVQSSTLALLFENNHFDYMPDFAIFADTQNEPQAVMEHLKYLQQTVTKFPIYITSKDDLADYPHKMPFFIKNEDGSQGMGWRQCTSEFKIKPIDKKLREVLGYQPRQRMKHKVNMLLGISTDEMQRQKEAREKWKENKWPLIDIGWSRQDCLSWYKENNYPTPPRSACNFCPYKSNIEWIHFKREYPEDFEKACEYDEFIRRKDIKEKYKLKGLQYVHRSMKPLREIDFKKEFNKKEEKRYSMLNECEGMCGL